MIWADAQSWKILFSLMNSMIDLNKVNKIKKATPEQVASFVRKEDKCRQEQKLKD